MPRATYDPAEKLVGRANDTAVDIPAAGKEQRLVLKMSSVNNAYMNECMRILVDAHNELDIVPNKIVRSGERLNELGIDLDFPGIREIRSHRVYCDRLCGSLVGSRR